MNLVINQKTISALKWIVEILNRRGIVYQISGGFAGKVLGSQRELNDIDFDMPDRYLKEIIPEISKYITYGPERYRDDKWDLELITLNYEGQEIDIAGSDTILMSNKERTKWIPIITDFSKAVDITVNGIPVKIIDPEDLIKYKEELDGDHQSEDIEATKQYLTRALG